MVEGASGVVAPVSQSLKLPSNWLSELTSRPQA